MPNYRRASVPGGTLFFTVNLLERRETLLVDHVDTRRGAIADTRRDYPFEIDAIVVLPDHIHAV
jgi:putative transposase